MSMFNYADFAKLANDMISGSGRVVKFRILSSTAADPSKPWLGPGKPTVKDEWSAYATFVPASGDFGHNLASDELLAKVQQVCLVAPNGKPVENTDLLIDSDGSKWGVVWANKLQPAGVPVLYALGVKK